MSKESKTLTVRLPDNLYRLTNEMAAERRISINALVQEGLAALIETEQRRRLYDAFTEVGEDLEVSDVEFGVPAQAEVVLNDR